MNIIDYLPRFIRDSVVCVFKTGSQIFCSNCKDSDYIVITNINIGMPLCYIKELKADCFIRSIDQFKAKITDDSWRYKLDVCLAYKYPENVVYGKLPELEADIFSKEYLLKILAIECEFAQRSYFVKYPLKSMVWGLALYYAIINNSLDFTDEQKEILQKAHDLELPISYRDELKVNFEKLLK